MPENDQRRVTPLELFFDLVYVFAFTQVTHLMAHHQSPETVLQGLSILGILWWSWASHAWLANHHAADRTVVRAGIVVAIIIVFLLSVAVPEAYTDRPGGLSAPLVFAIGFVTLSLTYTVVNLALAVGDPAFRRQVIRTMGVTIAPVSAALILGAVVGGQGQLILWLAAVVIEGATVFVTSHGGEWRVWSTAHHAERHGLVVLLALGESIISVGRGSAQMPMSALSAAGCLVAVSLSLGLWALYFARYAPAIETDVARRRDADRATIATLGTYVHLGIVTGILLVSLGLGHAVASLGRPEPLPMVAAAPLGIGLAMFVLSTAIHWWVATGHVAVARIAVGLLALAGIPLLASLDVLASMAAAAVLTLALVWLERCAAGRGAISAAVRF
jgi:low temperature requirement protein LtrA